MVAMMQPSKSDQHKHVCVESIYIEHQVEEDQVESGKRKQELISLKEEFIKSNPAIENKSSFP
jgi:hypothetical protein